MMRARRTLTGLKSRQHSKRKLQWRTLRARHYRHWRAIRRIRRSSIKHRCPGACFNPYFLKGE